MARRNRQENDGADNVRKRICEHENTLLTRTSRKVRSGEQKGHNNNTLCDGEEISLERREPEGLEDQVRECAETASGECVGERDDVEAPGLDVRERFDDLVPLELLVLDTGFVLAHTLDHQETVFGREALGTHGRIGEPPEDEDAPEDRKAAEEGEQHLPRGDRTAFDVVDAVGEQSADALLQAVHGVEATDGNGLLFLGVPHSGSKNSDKCQARMRVKVNSQEYESRLADTLEHAEERADDDKTSKVLASGGACKYGSPGSDAR